MPPVLGGISGVVLHAPVHFLSVLVVLWVAVLVARGLLVVGVLVVSRWLVVSCCGLLVVASLKI